MGLGNERELVNRAFSLDLLDNTDDGIDDHNIDKQRIFIGPNRNYKNRQHNIE